MVMELQHEGNGKGVAMRLTFRWVAIESQCVGNVWQWDCYRMDILCQQHVKMAIAWQWRIPMVFTGLERPGEHRSHSTIGRHRRFRFELNYERCRPMLVQFRPNSDDIAHVAGNFGRFRASGVDLGAILAKSGETRGGGACKTSPQEWILRASLFETSLARVANLVGATHFWAARNWLRQQRLART